MILGVSFPRLPLVVAAGLVAALGMGCGAGGFRSVEGGERQCALMDSLFANAGLQEALTFVGKAQVNANQYQVRGVVQLETDSDGDVYFEFRSSMLFGNRIEDFFCSIVDDTLRIVDRERGRIFEGRDADRVLAEDLGMDFDIRRALELALGGHPECSEIRELAIKPGATGQALSGRLDRGTFRVDFSPTGRIDRSEWPVPGDVAQDDRLRVEYEWNAESGAAVPLERMVIHLEKREWRCKLTSTTD